jgi:hypothetical protein
MSDPAQQGYPGFQPPRQPVYPAFPVTRQPPTAPPPFRSQPAPGQPVAPVKTPNPQRRQRIVALVTVAVILALLGGVLWATRHNPSTAKVGDCMKQTGTDSLEVVKCDDPKAAYKVVGKVADKTQVEAQFSACDAYQAQNAESAYWQGKSGKTGYVLCLAKTGK